MALLHQCETGILPDPRLELLRSRIVFGSFSDCSQNRGFTAFGQLLLWQQSPPLQLRRGVYGMPNRSTALRLVSSPRLSYLAVVVGLA